jgi:hypothetical protein
MTCGIYMLTLGTKTYIGKSTNIEVRLYTHESRARNGKFLNPFFKACYKKYGITNKEILFIVPREQLSHLERLCIKNMKSELNCAPGGDGGWSSAVVARTWRNNGTREKHSISMKAVWAKPEVKAQLSASAKAACAKPETKLARSIAQKTAWAKPEVKAKHRAVASNALKAMYAVPIRKAAWLAKREATRIARRATIPDYGKHRTHFTP